MSGRNNKILLALDIAQVLRGKPLMAGVAMAVLQSQPATAVSLGELRVQSALGQPFVASTTARLGPNETIVPGCITAPTSAAELGQPRGLKITAQTGNTPGIYPVQIRSTQPLYEPMYEIRLQIDCPGGVALAKSYVVMLNLPMSAPAETAQVVTAPTTQSREPQRARASTPNTRRTNSRSTAGNARLSATRDSIAAGGDYRVRNGDTLSMIAQRIQGRPAGSTWRVAEMLYQNNPQAFIRGNRDMIKLGAVLSIPDSATMAGDKPISQGSGPNIADNTQNAFSQPETSNNVRTTVELGRPEDSTAPEPLAEPNATSQTGMADVSNAELLREIREARATESTQQGGLQQRAATAATIASQAAQDNDSASPFADDTSAPAIVAETQPAAERAAPVTDQARTGGNSLMAILAGVGLGALLALLLLGKNLLTPWLAGRTRRKTAMASPAAEAVNAVSADAAPSQASFSPTRAAYGGGGIDVEIGEDPERSAETAQLKFNPFTVGDTDSETPTDDEVIADTASAPRVSLRPEPDDTEATSDFDSMLEGLDDADLQTPVADDNKARLIEEMGTMHNLFEETANENPGSDDVTAEMPDFESPTVEMDGADGITAEMPSIENTSDTTSKETVDIDITDLESLSQRLQDDSPDNDLSATLTQALDLLEQDYEEEFTQSQLLDQQQVAEAFEQHKKS